MDDRLEIVSLKTGRAWRWRIGASAGFGVAALSLLSACVSSLYNVPVRIVVDGGRGFSMEGSLKFTGDPELTKVRIQAMFNQACGSPATITQFDMHQIGNTGMKFYKYGAVAKCQK